MKINHFLKMGQVAHENSPVFEFQRSRLLVKLDQFLKGKVARETGPVSERGGRP